MKAHRFIFAHKVIFGFMATLLLLGQAGAQQAGLMVRPMPPTSGFRVGNWEVFGPSVPKTEYLPGEDVTVSVSLKNHGFRAPIQLKLEVKDPAGNVVYNSALDHSDPSFRFRLERDGSKSFTFTFKAPEVDGDYTYRVRVRNRYTYNWQLKKPGDNYVYLFRVVNDLELNATPPEVRAGNQMTFHLTGGLVRAEQAGAAKVMITGPNGYRLGPIDPRSINKAQVMFQTDIPANAPPGQYKAVALGAEASFEVRPDTVAVAELSTRSVSVTPASPIVGQPVTLTAVVKNSGNSEITIQPSFDVNGQNVQAVTAQRIAARAEATFTAPYSFPTTGNVPVKFPATSFGDANVGDDVKTITVTVTEEKLNLILKVDPDPATTGSHTAFYLTGPAVEAGQVKDADVLVSGPDGFKNTIEYAYAAKTATQVAFSMFIPPHAPLGSYKATVLGVSANFTVVEGGQIPLKPYSGDGPCGGDVLIDFEGATGNPTDYLKGFGITISGDQAQIRSIDDCHSAVCPPSGRNTFYPGRQGNGPATSITLKFDAPLKTVCVTRANLQVRSPNWGGITHPQWSMVAFDAEGKQVGQTGEGPMGSYQDIPGKTFSISASGITSVKITGSGNNFAAFNCPVLDNLALTYEAGPPPITLELRATPDHTRPGHQVTFHLTGDAGTLQRIWAEKTPLSIPSPNNLGSFAPKQGTPAQVMYQVEIPRGTPPGTYQALVAGTQTTFIVDGESAPLTITEWPREFTYNIQPGQTIDFARIMSVKGTGIQPGATLSVREVGEQEVMLFPDGREVRDEGGDYDGQKWFPHRMQFNVLSATEARMNVLEERIQNISFYGRQSWVEEFWITNPDGTTSNHVTTNITIIGGPDTQVQPVQLEVFRLPDGATAGAPRHEQPPAYPGELLCIHLKGSVDSLDRWLQNLPQARLGIAGPSRLPSALGERVRPDEMQFRVQIPPDAKLGMYTASITREPQAGGGGVSVQFEVRTIQPPTRLDVALSNATVEPGAPVAGEPATLSVTATNKGTQGLGITVRVYVNEREVGTLGDRHITAPGGIETYRLPYAFAALGDNRVKFVAEVSDDATPDNNTVEKTVTVTQKPGPVVTGIIVPATVGGTTGEPPVNSGVDVAVGDIITFSATGMWGIGPAPRYHYGPDGPTNSSTPGYYGIAEALMPQEKTGMLIGRIGAGPWFAIGSNRTITATTAGRIYLIMNDGITWLDNHGEVGVTINIAGGSIPFSVEPARIVLSTKNIVEGVFTGLTLAIKGNLADGNRLTLTFADAPGLPWNFEVGREFSFTWAPEALPIRMVLAGNVARTPEGATITFSTMKVSYIEEQAMDDYELNAELSAPGNRKAGLKFLVTPGEEVETD